MLKDRDRLGLGLGFVQYTHRINSPLLSIYHLLTNALDGGLYVDMLILAAGAVGLGVGVIVRVHITGGATSVTGYALASRCSVITLYT